MYFELIISIQFVERSYSQNFTVAVKEQNFFKEPSKEQQHKNRAKSTTCNFNYES